MDLESLRVKATPNLLVRWLLFITEEVLDHTGLLNWEHTQDMRLRFSELNSSSYESNSLVIGVDQFKHRKIGRPVHIQSKYMRKRPSLQDQVIMLYNRPIAEDGDPQQLTLKRVAIHRTTPYSSFYVRTDPKPQGNLIAKKRIDDYTIPSAEVAGSSGGIYESPSRVLKGYDRFRAEELKILLEILNNTLATRLQKIGMQNF